VGQRAAGRAGDGGDADPCPPCLRFKDAPIVAIDGGALGKFEAALYPVKAGKGWAMLYNTEVSDGRRRFTIAHEFGHYLMHRSFFPKDLECSEEAVTFRNETSSRPKRTRLPPTC